VRERGYTAGICALQLVALESLMISEAELNREECLITINTYKFIPYPMLLTLLRLAEKSLDSFHILLLLSIPAATENKKIPYIKEIKISDMTNKRVKDVIGNISPYPTVEAVIKLKYTPSISDN
jgi:hypothetical protein